MKIEDIFKDAETLTLEEFQAKAKEGGANFADLSEGKYVSVSKHNSEIQAKDDQISTLNDTLSERDKDLASLKDQLKDAGNDAEKLSTVSADLSALQSKYEEDTKAFQTKLDNQAREFAIKEHAATKNFTSNAAKRDYIASMQSSEDVKLKKGELVGVKDFDEAYSKDNEEAFIKNAEDSENEPNNNIDQQNNSILPMFAQPTPGESTNNNVSGKESFGFSFIPQQQ